MTKLKCAVLFDGAGLARLGLEQSGAFDCTGYELDPLKHYLSKHVGSGNSILADVTKVDLSGYDAVWASPPCQLHSMATTQGKPISQYAGDFLKWSLDLPHPILWVENVVGFKKENNQWGKLYNAAQFLQNPIQNRNRIIGGRYKEPKVFHPYKKTFKGICPAILASEYKGSAVDDRRACRFYKRKLTLDECAYHMGLPQSILDTWRSLPIPNGIKKGEWNKNLYQAIGNGVFVPMAKSFGEAYL